MLKEQKEKVIEGSCLLTMNKTIVVGQQQQPIGREIEAQNSKRKREPAIYSQSIGKSQR